MPIKPYYVEYEGKTERTETKPLDKIKTVMDDKTISKERKKKWDEEHPLYTKSEKRISTVGKRLSKVGGKFLKATPVLKRGKQVGRTTGRRVRDTGRFDTAMGVEIAREATVQPEAASMMDRDFFGDRDKETNIGSGFQKDFFGNGNKNLIGDRNKDVNIGSNVEKNFFGNQKKRRLI